MRLFNKTIDRQLFKQYALGSDLSKQEVVVKIFNPMGAQSWFILNSDPNDPDYLWAIVDLGYGAEVGSVSRSDLETYRGRFGLGFERDLSFDPINAEELYEGLRRGEYYAKGGNLSRDRKFLNHSQNYEVEYSKGKNRAGYGNLSFADGGEVSFIDYKDCEIMYEPHYKKYYANDVEFDSLKEAKEFIDSGEIDPSIRDAYSKGLFADGGKLNNFDEDQKFENFKNSLIKHSDKYELGEGYNSRYKGLKNKIGDTSTGEYLIEGNNISWNYLDKKGNIYNSNEVPELIIDLTGTGVYLDKRGFADGGEVTDEDYAKRLQYLKMMKNNERTDFGKYNIDKEIRQINTILEHRKNFKNSFANGGGVSYPNHYLEAEDLKEQINNLTQQIDSDYRNEEVDEATERMEDDLSLLKTKLEMMMYGKDEYANGGSLGNYDVVIDGDWDEPKKFKTFSLAKKWIYQNAKNYESLELVDTYGDTIFVEGNSTKEDLDWLFSNDEVSSFANGGLTPITKNSLPNEEVLYNFKKIGLDGKVEKESVGFIFFNKHLGGIPIFVNNQNDDFDYKELDKTGFTHYQKEYANGGNISDFSDNQQMIMNQNVEVEHHHEELEDILENKVPVPAWVVAKMETATQNLSDITHYLDGEKELMEDEKEDENEEEDEDQDEIENKEVVEPINVSAGTKAELTKKFTDDAMGNLKGFLKGMEGIDLRDDYTFDYKNEQFEVEPIINSDDNGVSNAVFTIFDGDGEEQGEITYSREGGKQKFTANSMFFQWRNAKFEDGGYFDGTIPKVSTYMTTYADGGSLSEKEQILEALENYDSDDNEFEEDQQFFVTDDLLGFIRGLRVSDKESIVEALSDYDGDDFVVTSPLLSFVENINLNDNYAKGGEIAKAEIFGLSRNIMGTTDIEMKITGMRKAQDFIVYPIGADDAGNVITIQSDTRIGQINLVKGVGVMSQSHSSGAYFVHLQMDKLTSFTISESDLENLKAFINKTSGANVGSSVVKSDNSGASGVYAKGGSFEKVMWQDVEIGDSARVKELNRMGLITHTYGRKFNIKFPNGTEKTFDASDLEFYKLEKDQYELDNDNNFAKGGVTYFDDRNQHYLGRPSGSIEKEIYAKVKDRIDADDFVGSFGWKIVSNKQANIADGFLYKLDDYDQNLIKNLNLKQGEKVFRYVNRTTAIGGMMPFIKINIEKALLYFPVSNDNDDIIFETKSVKPMWINLIEGSFAHGGGLDMKYYVIDVKDGKVVSKGFDTEEEAKVEKFEIFEKTNNFFLSQKKMSKNEVDELSEQQYAKGGDLVKTPFGHGEFLWFFNWKDGGFNEVYAETKAKAIKKATQKGYPTYMPDNEYARKRSLQDIKDQFGQEAVDYIRSQSTWSNEDQKYYSNKDLKLTDVGFSKGLVPDGKTFRKQTYKDSRETTRMGNMMSMADGGGIELGDVVEVKEPNYGRDSEYYVVDNKAGYNEDGFLLSETRKREQGVFEEDQLNKLYADGGFMNDVYANGGGLDMKYYVIDVKDGKVVSKGFDTEEEAKVEKFEIFEKTNNFFLSQKKMSKNEADGLSEQQYAKGGITYYKNENERLSRPKSDMEQEVFDKVKNQINPELFSGNFGWKAFNNKLAYGYLYALDDFDKDYVKNVKLKQGEVIFRYVTRITAISGSVPFIKINIEKSLLYFPVSLDDEDVIFETRGVTPLWISLIEGSFADGGFMNDVYAYGGQIRIGDRFKSTWTDGKNNSGYDIIEIKKQDVTSGKDFKTKVMITEIVDSSSPERIGLKGEEYKPNFKKNIGYGLYESMQDRLIKSEDKEYADGGKLSKIETSKSGKLKTDGEVIESWYNVFGEGIVNDKGEEVGSKMNDINKDVVYYQVFAKDTPENREGYGWEEHNDEVGFIFKKFATIDDLERFLNEKEIEETKEALLPKGGSVKKDWWHTVVNPNEDFNNFDDKMPIDWDVDDFKSWVVSNSDIDGNVDKEVLDVVKMPKSKLLVEYLNKNGSGKNNNEFYKKYGNWQSALYDIFTQMKKDYLFKKSLKYVLKADIKTVTVKTKNGKEVTYSGADVLNGNYVLAKGGDITSKATYFGKNNVVGVELKDGTTVKPVNGYWVKKGAEPISNEPTPAISVKSETNVGQTFIKKGAYGWSATTTINDFNNYDWKVSTHKTSRGELITTAQGGKFQKGDGYTTFKFMMYEDPFHTLEVSKPSRLTEKVVAEQHAKGLDKFKKFMETGMFKGGGKISNFDKLSAKVAKQYEGKPVKNQYQEEYGKFYSKEEAQEVGDKVAGKVKAMQTDSKAFGGLFNGVKKMTTPSQKYPNIEGKQVALKTGEFVEVFSQSGSNLTVLELGKIGSGKRPYPIDISEIDLTSFKAGGETEIKKTNKGSEILKQANELAKKIRMDGESWTDAKKRAFAQLKK